MKLIVTLGVPDSHGCRDVGFEVESGGDMRTADRYDAGTLYLRREHAEPIIRRLEGSSGGFVGEVEVRHA